MPTKFEDAVTALKAEHFEEPATLQLIDIVVAQNERIKNLEHESLVAKSRLGVSERIQNEHTESIASLARTRDESVARINTIETKPVEDNKRLDELDTRVTTVEGAVGSKAYRRAEARQDPSLKPTVVDEAMPKPAGEGGWSPPNLVG
jgi:wobble nucleotide-excising tRNase